MKIAVFAFAVLLSAFTVSSGFLAGQKLFERVRTAFEEKETLINRKLANAGIKPVEVYILLTAYKAEGKLELYAKRKAESTYKKLVSYDVCARSGGLGPKRRKGDKQVPEGFYVIDRFNPNSQFYLSLGINYPTRPIG